MTQPTSLDPVPETGVTAERWTIDDVLYAIGNGDLQPAVCARDLPMDPIAGAALLRTGWREGSLHRLLPGVYWFSGKLG